MRKYKLVPGKYYHINFGYPWEEWECIIKVDYIVDDLNHYSWAFWPKHPHKGNSNNKASNPNSILFDEINFSHVREATIEEMNNLNMYYDFPLIDNPYILEEPIPDDLKSTRLAQFLNK